jgi:hypothetical protein
LNQNPRNLNVRIHQKVCVKTNVTSTGAAHVALHLEKIDAADDHAVEVGAVSWLTGRKRRVGGYTPLRV